MSEHERWWLKVQFEITALRGMASAMQSDGPLDERALEIAEQSLRAWDEYKQGDMACGGAVMGDWDSLETIRAECDRAYNNLASRPWKDGEAGANALHSLGSIRWPADAVLVERAVLEQWKQWALDGSKFSVEREIDLYLAPAAPALEPCPYCATQPESLRKHSVGGGDSVLYACWSNQRGCGLSGLYAPTERGAADAWNEVARAVRAARGVGDD